MAAEATAGKHLSSCGTDLKPWSSGSPEKGQKALAEMENAREISSTGQECDSITQTKRELAGVAALPKHRWLNRSGQAELPAKENPPLLHLWQWKQTVLAENWAALGPQSRQSWERTLPIWSPQWLQQQKLTPGVGGARWNEMMPKLSTGGKGLPLVFH